MRLRALAAAAALALASATAAFAHEARPGFLELRETGPGTYSFLWKKPTGGEVEIQIAPVVPGGCRLVTSDRQQPTPGAMIVRGMLTCEGGLAGKTIAIAGLPSTITDVLVRVHHADGRLESHLLRPATPSVTLGAVTSAGARALSYVQIGVQHILLGIDHLLFVLGLLLIVSNRWMLVKTITSFWSLVPRHEPCRPGRRRGARSSPWRQRSGPRSPSPTPGRAARRGCWRGFVTRSPASTTCSR